MRALLVSSCKSLFPRFRALLSLLLHSFGDAIQDENHPLQCHYSLFHVKHESGTPTNPRRRIVNLLESATDTRAVKMKLPDIQKEQRPPVEFPIQKVGIIGEKRLVHFYNKYLAKTGEDPNTEIYCEISLCTDISPTVKGTHMSRLVEVIGKYVGEAHPSLEDFAVDLARSAYTALSDIGLTRTIAEVSGEMTINKYTPASHLPSQETLKIEAKATFDGSISRCEIGVTVPIFIVCPCAQELVKSRVSSILLEEKLDQTIVNKICNLIPMPSHNQRGFASVFIELPPKVDIDFRDIAKIVHARFNQIYSVLKRDDELEVVYKAHLNPTFVEDACRELAEGVYESLGEKMKPESAVRILVMSEESIHQHNAFAQIEMSFEQLKSIMNVKRNLTKSV